MNPYIELLRPNVCLLTALGLVVGAIVAGTASLTPIFAYAILAAFVICGAGDAINDYFDRNIDKVNAPRRPIPSCRVTAQSTLAYFIVLSVVGITLAYFVSTTFLAIAAFNWLIAAVYPWRAKKIPVVKNIFVAYLAASSFIAAGFVSGITLPLILIFLIAIAFIVTLGREIVKDIEDITGDLKAGIKTLPTLIGEKPAKAIAYILLAIACITLLLPLYFQLLSYYYLAGAIPAIAICAYSLRLNAHKAQKLLKLAMFLAMIGFLIGALVR
jgi:geranylgeranylglycerol-phosphate geranylgeranyltransferase